MMAKACWCQIQFNYTVAVRMTYAMWSKISCGHLMIVKSSVALAIEKLHFRSRAGVIRIYVYFLSPSSSRNHFRITRWCNNIDINNFIAVNAICCQHFPLHSLLILRLLHKKNS